jgi:tight adherence protein B
MDGLLLPILIALSVGLLVFAVAQIATGGGVAEKRRLRQRLSTERYSASAEAERSILLQQQEQGISALLVQFSPLAALQARLRHAFPETSLAKFLGISLGGTAVVALMAFALSASPVVALIAGGVGLYIPFLVVSSRGAKRQKLLADQLPDALDFLSRILRAGHSFSTGLQMMAQELPQPLAAEFQRAYDQHSLGTSIEDALKEVTKRIESTDFAFFVTAVLIQRQTGGDLSEVLNNISDMIRQRIRLQQHVKAKTAEGRFTGYILAAFPAVMFLIAYTLNPDYAGVLVKTGTGLMLLGIAVGLQLIGLYFIRKITTLHV